MSETPDDPPGDDPKSSATGASTPESGDGDAEIEADTESGADIASPAERESVAASAGIDEAVLDVSRELASTVRLQWVLGSTFGAAVVGLVVTGIAYALGIGTNFLAAGLRPAATVGVGAFVLLALFGVVRSILLYRSWSYVVRADSLFLSRGVFTRVRTVVPYVRVQHIDTTRSPMERLLGLSTLVVYTAGSRGADVTIPGLSPDRASTLQGRLERLATESEETDAV